MRGVIAHVCGCEFEYMCALVYSIYISTYELAHVCISVCVCVCITSLSFPPG